MTQPEFTEADAATLAARVFALVQACPVGRVTTYSAIAKALGYPRGARMIGWIMQDATEGVPAQRVVSSTGELTGNWAFGGTMRQRLEAEGITFTDDGKVDLKRYGWEPLRDLTDAEREAILAEATTQSAKVSPRTLYHLKHDPASPFRAGK
jgi:methylated-DNA-protein-cysteine methyltransferase related protein